MIYLVSAFLAIMLLSPATLTEKPAVGACGGSGWRVMSMLGLARHSHVLWDRRHRNHSGRISDSMVAFIPSVANWGTEVDLLAARKPALSAAGRLGASANPSEDEYGGEDDS